MSGVPVTTGTTAVPWAARNPFTSIEFLAAVGLLVVALLVGAFAVYLIDKWRKRQMATGHESVGTLAMYRAMFERGEITESEYQTILAKMAPKVKQEVTAANPSLAAGPAVGAKTAAETIVESGETRDGKPPPDGELPEPRNPPAG